MYRLFINEEFCKNLVIDNSIDTNILDTIILYDDESNPIPKMSSEYKTIVFSAPEQPGILLKDSIVLKNSKPSTYVIYANFRNQVENFELTIQKKKSNRAVEISDIFIDEKWLIETINSLNKNHIYEKIAITLNSLAIQTDTYNENSKKSDILIISFLIRALLEFSSKAYYDKYLEGKIPKPDNLAKYVKAVAEDMYLKNRHGFTLENKKVILRIFFWD